MTRLSKPLGHRFKRITLCADDFAQNTTISEGIVCLATQQRISAIGCMVNSPAWTEAASMLPALKSSTFMGLHMNLTHGNALSSAWKKKHGEQLPGMACLMRMAYLRRLDPAVIAAEIQAQLDAYTQMMNAQPDFMDGHQHIHQLPVIREVLFELSGHQVCLRKTTQGWRDVLSTDGAPKRQLIALLGGMTFNRRLKQLTRRTNTSFSGIYNFINAPHYRHYFNQFLNYSQDGGLIMCHPGGVSDDLSDPLYLHRQHELAYFMSDEFLSDLAICSVELALKRSEHNIEAK